MSALVKTVKTIKTIKESNICRIIGFMMISVLVICCTWNLYYGTVDEVFYRNIITGKYTGTPRPSGTMIKYPLALIISFVSQIFSEVDVFGCFLAGSHLLCFFLAGRCVFRSISGYRKRALFLFGVVFWLVGVPNMIYLQFTTTAAVYASTGVFLLLLEREGIDNHLPSLCMFAMSVCVRKETFLMTVPFMLLVWLLKLRDAYVSGQKMQKSCRRCAVYLLIVGLLYCGIVITDDLAGDQDAVHEQWRTDRTNVRDYDGVPDYDTYPEFYRSFGENGLSKEEVSLMTRQMVVFDFSTDIHDVFRDMHSFNVANRSNLGIKYKLSKAVRLFLTLWDRVMVRPQIVIAILTCVIVLAWLVCMKKYVYALFAAAGGMGVAGEAFLLFYRGRMPERVMQSLMFLCVLFLCGMLLHSVSGIPEAYADKNAGMTGGRKRGKITASKVCYALMSAAYVIVFFALLLPGINEKQAEYEKRYRKNTIVNEYCGSHPENVYFTTGSIGDTDRLGSRYNNDFVNYISPMLNLGPAYRELLQAAGIEGSAEKAITTQENVYLLGVEGNADFIALDEYFASKYGSSYSCEMVERLEDSYCVWKVRLSSEGNT